MSNPDKNPTRAEAQRSAIGPRAGSSRPLAHAELTWNFPNCVEPMAIAGGNPIPCAEGQTAVVAEKRGPTRRGG